MRGTARVLLVAWPLLATAAGAQIECPPSVVELVEATPVTGNGAICYQFQIPEASPFVRFDVDASEAIDLYFTEGVEQSLSDWDRVNATPIDGDAKFILLEPEPGQYTVAVAPEGGAASYSLSASASIGAGGDSSFLVCSDDGGCSAAIPMMAAPQAIQLGSSFGDRVILPLTLTGPGKVEITADWFGSAHELILILDGPRRPDLLNPSQYYARSLGQSPLKLTYNVTAEDLEGGKRFQVSLVNFSGGEASGGIDIKTPPTVRFNYVHLAKVANLKPLAPGRFKPIIMQPAEPKPTTPKKPVILQPQPGLVLVKTQDQLCREAVQDKIAWNYDGAKRWADGNLARLCKGTKKASEPARCFQQVMHGNLNWGGGTRWRWQNAIDLCEGTSSASRTIRCFTANIERGRPWKDAIGTCNPLRIAVPPAKTPEQVCREAVQDKIAWNYDGAKRWAENNLSRLCKGTTQGSEPARCFQRAMHGGLNWGGGTRWQWQNALDLCERTSSAARTIDCFTANIKRGRPWRDAIQACGAR